MPHVTLTHDDQVADFATLCAGVGLGGTVSVGEAAYLGMNASVREELSVGAARPSWAWARSSCTTCPHGETWVGVPARPLRGPS